MKQKQVVDIHPGKGMTLAQSNEHLRVASKGAYKSRLSNNFDPTREHLNFEVKPGGVISPLDKSNSIPKRIRKNIKERGVVDPNSVLETPFVIFDFPTQKYQQLQSSFHQKLTCVLCGTLQTAKYKESQSNTKSIFSSGNRQSIHPAKFGYGNNT